MNRIVRRVIEMARKSSKPKPLRRSVRRGPPVTNDRPKGVASPIPRIQSNYRVERWQQRHSPNPAMLRNVMSKEGFTVYQWSDPPGTVYGMHKHGSHQSHWIVSGALEIRVEGRSPQVLGPGDRDYMPANTYHSARVLSDEAVIYLVGEV